MTVRDRPSLLTTDPTSLARKTDCQSVLPQDPNRLREQAETERQGDKETGRQGDKQAKQPVTPQDDSIAAPRPRAAASPRKRRWHRLSEFAVGACNRVAHASALSVIEDPGQGANPL